MQLFRTIMATGACSEAASMNESIDLLTDAISNRKHYEVMQKKNAEKFCGKVDGKAANRIIELIKNEMLQQNQG